MQLIILGMHRSGTSVLARLINLMGVYFGPEGISTGANQENPKGFWERRDVRALNDLVLQGSGCDWNRVSTFDLDAVPLPILQEFNTRASRLILEMDAHRPWMLKEPRLCLLLPLWRRWMEMPIGIHIYRNPVEVASSLQKRNGIPMEAGLALWERYVSSALQASADIPQLVVSHRQLMQEPAVAIATLLLELEALGVPGLRMPAEREFDAFIRQDLYRERKDRDDLRPYLNARQVKVFNALESGGLLPGDLPVDTAGALALATYESELPPLGAPGGAPPETADALRGQLALRNQEIKFARDFAGKREAAIKLEGDVRLRDERVASLEREAKAAREAATQRETLEAELRKRDARIAAQDAQIRVLQEDAARFQAAQETLQLRLQEDAARFQAAQEKLQLRRQEDAARFQTAQEKLQLQLQECEDGLKEKDREIQALQADREKAERNIDLRHRELAALTRLLLEREDQLEDAVSMSKQLGDTIDNMRRSRSWRITSPLRAGLRLLGRNNEDAQEYASEEARLLASSGLFDETWYVQNYPEVARSGLQPVEHFLRMGAPERKDPGPAFSTAGYLQHNPDVEDANINPLLHYVVHGKAEGRRWN